MPAGRVAGALGRHPLTAQTVLVALLLAAPVAAAVAFAIGGWLQGRRRDRLARAAHEAGLLFSGEDPFDVSRRYADSALLGAGHAGRATNVTYGRVGGLPVRAFDFRYEIGHGTRRQARHYAVVAVEALGPVAPLLLWRWRDADLAPLAVRQATQRLGEWDARGEAPRRPPPCWASTGCRWLRASRCSPRRS